MAEKDMCCMPDWEAECKRLTDLNEQLKMKLCDMDCRCRALEMDAERLRAQMDVVRLIFGKG